MSENVNHPGHYGGDTPYEAIKVIEAWDLGFHLGNAVKYISRAGKKDPTKLGEDIDKAIWYLQRFLEAEFEKAKANYPDLVPSGNHSCNVKVVSEGPPPWHVEDPGEPCGKGCPVWEAKWKAGEDGY